MARRVASGLAGLASAARLHLARGSAALRGAGARVPEPDRRVPEASRRSAPSSGEDDDGPLRWYRRRVREGSLRADARQVEALESLQDLRTRLADPRGARLGREHALWRASPVTGEGTEAVGGLVFSQDKSQGVYLHGGVGRGKTMLMDAFFATLPEHVKRKARRVHFHAFMAEVHARLHALTKSTHHTRVRFARDGSSFSLDARITQKERDVDVNETIVTENDPRRDPLALVANEIVVRSPLVCFDEVELSDVADALVFKRVFEKVFEYGGVLVATSNAAPAKLYDGGINRGAFAPFTRELEKRTKVVSLDDELFSRREGVACNDVSTDSTVVHRERGGHGGSVDHRRVNREREAAATKKERAGRDAAEHPRPSRAAGNRSALLVKTLFCSFGNDTVHDRDLTDALLATFSAATSGVEQHDAEIAISAGRFLRVPSARGRGCRFSFVDLFGSHARLGAADYSTLLARYDVVCVDTVIPAFRSEDEDALRRFVNFIDIAYETKTLLIAATEVSPEALVEADDARDWFLVSESDASSDASSTSTSTSTDGSSVFSTRARVRLEGSRGAFALDNERGGSSGRVAPMVGDAEWSATGRNGAALADLQLHNFTFRAAARCVSRLCEMGGEAYEAAWWEEELARRRREREEAGTEVRAAMKRT